MNIDNKHPFLKSFLSEQSLNKQSLKSSIDQSSINSAGQKSLGQQLPQNNEEQSSKKEQPSLKKKSLQLNADGEKNNLLKNEKSKIERDPMKLLKIVSSLVLFSLFSPAITYSETIIMVGDKWCPFNCDPKSSKLGYMVEVAKVIFERKGHNIDYQINSWVKSIEKVRNAKATALVATTKYDAPDFIYPSKSMGSNKDCFYVRAKDKWAFNEINDLKTRKLGTAEGYAYSALLVSFINENPKLILAAHGTDPLSMNLKNLDEAKVDTIVENPFVFNYMVHEEKIREKYEEAGCTDDNDLYIAFSPKNPRAKEFAKILTDGIEELRKDGTLDKIVAKYALKDWR